MNKMVTINANAKINLTLDILGKRTDGYHEVSMVMPKLHGSKAQLLPKLDALEQIVDSESYPLVTKKIGEMKNNLKKGYASFIGD